MKLKTSRNLFAGVIALGCLGLFILGLMRAGDFNVPARPPKSQTAIAQKMYQPSAEPVAATPKAAQQPPVAQSQPTKAPAAAVSSPPGTIAPSDGLATTLPNTGPGPVIFIFVLAVFFGTAAAYVWRVRQTSGTARL